MKVDKIYLDDELKNYYSNCLEEEIKLKKIDNGLIEPLRLISNSKNIRPIFSKKNKDSIGRNNHSYLVIAFTVNVESILLTEIKHYFLSKFNTDRNYKCSFIELNPYSKENGRAVTEVNKGSKWLIDAEYFNVNQIRFELKKGSKELHIEFWNELSSMLANLE